MTKILQGAYPESATEYDEFWEKYPAFASAPLSKKAEEEGAYASSDYSNSGFSFTRSAVPGSSSGVSCACWNGVRVWNDSYDSLAGLRPALQLIYNLESGLVKGQKVVEKNVNVFNCGRPEYEDTGRDKKIEGSATVVNYAGIEYIWFNKAECEKGTDKTMKLKALEMVERAVPFDREMENNDYGKADELRAQHERAVFENATAKELSLVCPVELDSEDGYENATPAPERQVEFFVNLYNNGAIDIEKLLQAIELTPFKQGITDGTLDSFVLQLRDKAAEHVEKGEVEAVKGFGEIIKKLIAIKSAENERIATENERIKEEQNKIKEEAKKAFEGIDEILETCGIKKRGENE